MSLIMDGFDLQAIGYVAPALVRADCRQHPGSRLQEASLQDGDEIHDIFANLLANAADPRQGNPVYPSFALMVKEVTASQVPERTSDALVRSISSTFKVPIGHCQKPPRFHSNREFGFRRGAVCGKLLGRSL
jgi:hypothetical protein